MSVHVTPAYPIGCRCIVAVIADSLHAPFPWEFVRAIVGAVAVLVKHGLLALAPFALSRTHLSCHTFGGLNGQTD